MISAESIAVEMRNVFGADERRINHALTVLEYARRILRGEAGDVGVVTAAALLHDIGIHEAERKYNSSAARYQELEGPPIAEGILESLGAEPEFIAEVCDIVGHHHSPRLGETTNFKILYDADLITNIRESANPPRKMTRKAIEKKKFMTPTGLAVALEALT
jgi:HD superfamily phosphodiesterase